MTNHHFKKSVGSRREVWNGTAKHTSGGLTKTHLMMSHGRIVSKAKHNTAKKEMRLLKHGYGTKKGKFGYVKISPGSKKHKMHGGHSSASSTLFPADSGSSYEISTGGRRRSRHRRSAKHKRGCHCYGCKMSGGSGMKAPGDYAGSNWNGDHKLQ